MPGTRRCLSVSVAVFARPPGSCSSAVLPQPALSDSSSVSPPFPCPDGGGVGVGGMGGEDCSQTTS